MQLARMIRRKATGAAVTEWRGVATDRGSWAVLCDRQGLISLVSRRFRLV